MSLNNLLRILYVINSIGRHQHLYDYKL